MTSIFNNRRVLRECVIYLFLGIISFGLSRIGIKGNYFVFSVPFILSCFLNDKWQGFFSFFVSYLSMIFYREYRLIYLFVLVSVLLFKYIKRNKKVESLIGLYCFFVVLIASVLILYVNKSHEYLLLFILPLFSYWVMKYFFNLYKVFHVSDDKTMLPYLTSFMFFAIGLAFIGLKIEIFSLDVSLILLVLLTFISSKVSLEVGVVYSLLVCMVLSFYDGFNKELLLFGVCSLLCFFMNKTSKVTLVFTFSLVVGAFVYYYKINYLLFLPYLVGAFLYLFVPSSFVKKISEYSFGSEQNIKRLKEEYKERNVKFSNKILKMEDTFALVTSKLNIKERIKKSDRELLLEEIEIFNELLKEFAREVKEDKTGNNKYLDLEREIAKYNVDFLYFKEEGNFFNESVIKINVRCDEVVIKNILLPLISNHFERRYEIYKIKNNNIFDYKEVTFKSVKKVSFNYGVGQLAKDGVCGDSYLVYETDRKCYFAISDGMGVGELAKEKSKLALDIFKKFIDVGFDEKRAIISLNNILKKKYFKDNYTTLDLLIYDKFLNQYSFYKNGACNSYVYNNDGFKVVEGNELPLGIIDKVELKENVVSLGKNDYLFMFSDGVDENKLFSKDVFNYKDPQRMVREILKRRDELDDDETVFVIRVK